MTDSPIASEQEYVDALAELSRLMDLPEGSDEAAGLEQLAKRIEAYEAIHYPMEDE